MILNTAKIDDNFCLDRVVIFRLWFITRLQNEMLVKYFRDVVCSLSSSLLYVALPAHPGHIYKY